MIKVLFAVVLSFLTISSVRSEDTWPLSHPAGAIYKQLKWSSRDVMDAYFWWENGFLWEEIIPVTTGPFVCSGDYEAIQSGVQLGVALTTKTTTSFCGSLYLPSQVFKLLSRSSPSLDSQKDITIVYDGLSTALFISIPKAPAPILYDLSVGKNGQGSITSSPAGINCGSSCSASFLAGSSVTLSATPSQGYTFSEWSGVCVGSGACTVTMDSAKIATAKFIVTPTPVFSLTIQNQGNGLVTSNPAGISCGSTCVANFAANSVVTLTAQANEGYTFTGWGGACVGTATCTVNINSANTVVASFALTPKNQYPVTVTLDGKGSVASSLPGISCGASCSAAFTEKSSISLIATPEVGYVFAGWGGSCSGSGSCVLTVDSAKNVTARFVALLPQKTLSIKKIGEGRVLSSEGKIDCGNVCMAGFDVRSTAVLTVTPADGYKFKAWSGACSGSKACRVKMTLNKVVTARFLKK